MSRTGWIVAAGILAALAAPLSYALEARAVNACRGSGGSYDFDAGACDPDTLHPVRPWAPRSRPALAMTAAGVALLIITGASAGFRRTRSGP